MLVLILDAVDNKFYKRHVEAKDIEKIDQHLADQRELQIIKDEKPVTADDISLYLLSQK